MTRKIIVIDLESTCWKGKPPSRQVSEIIEIGICVLDSDTGKITQNQGILIKPKVSKVSPFCTELTTITQDLLDKEGISFKEAINKIQKEYDPKEYTWASYGGYDLKMLKNQCSVRGIKYPMSDNHINVKDLFSNFNNSKRIGMKGALKKLKIPLDGTHHRGVDDARNISKILNWCLNNK